MMARHGYEVELKPDRFHMELILGHTQPLSPKIFVTLRENGFEFRLEEKRTYTDLDGAIRCRSRFRRAL
jgi:hypothetical protein